MNRKKQLEMEREEAIEYLERKGIIKEVKHHYKKGDESRIREVMKEGKIYGDPLVSFG
jgi:hypothetical protein